MKIHFREATQADLSFLEKMLFEAFFWHPEQTRPPFLQFLRQPEIQKGLADWGRAGDRAIIALVNEALVGAAWYRLWTDDEHSYGYVDSNTPEVGMAVVAGQRSQGVGRALLRRLVEVARVQRMPALSLSVEPANFALRLYESEGFVKIGESGTSWTMILYL
ncbi:MAG: GNAT family N-acetyltransferase [bacterium]